MAMIKITIISVCLVCGVIIFKLYILCIQKCVKTRMWDKRENHFPDHFLAHC